MFEITFLGYSPMIYNQQAFSYVKSKVEHPTKGYALIGYWRIYH